MEDENTFDDSTAEQAGNKPSPADRLRPWMFKKGQSGNPSGRPKGSVSLKEWAKNYIQTLTDEERLEFLEGMNKKDVWEMAEGKAVQGNEVKLNGDVTAHVLVKFMDEQPG